MDHYTSFLLVLIVLIGHFAIIEMMARSRYFALGISIIALLSFPYWIQKFEGWFYFLKILSIWIPLLVFGIIKALYPGSAKAKVWAANFARIGFFLLSLNILEASVKGFQVGNYFNSSTGFLLTLILPIISSKNWIADHYKNTPFLIYADTPYFYIFLYSTWNICFVYSVFPQYFFIVALSLCYCFCHIYLIKSPRLWFSFRTFTLGFILMIRANTDLVENYLDLSYLHHPIIAKIWGCINLFLLLGYLFWEGKREIANSLIGRVLTKSNN
jgi:hypothetical protein